MQEKPIKIIDQISFYLFIMLTWMQVYVTKIGS